MKYLTLLSVCLLLVSCNDTIDTDFCEAVVFDDVNYLQDYIDDILEDLDPRPLAEDPLGHEENLFILADELNSQNPCLTAEVLCYACVKTLPPQSELIITVNDGAGFITKVIDVVTPEEETMFFVGIHLP